jgi:hypothetical protein
MSHRDALVRALLPLDAPLDTGTFWPRFDRSAPTHLRAALAVGVAVLAVLGPLLTTGRTLRASSPDQRERFITRAAAAPLVRALVPVLRLVACWAWFDDDRVDAVIVGPP